MEYIKKLSTKENELVKDFFENVVIYCALIENCDSVENEKFLKKVFDAITKLMNLGMVLPDVPSVNEQPLKRLVDSKQRLKIISKVNEKLGKYDYYWFVFDSIEGGDPVGSFLGGDLVDIYLDLKIGLETFNKSGEDYKFDAIWHWLFGYRYSWGTLAVNDIKAVYDIIVNY